MLSCYILFWKVNDVIIFYVCCNAGKSAKMVIDSARKHVADLVGASSEGEFNESYPEIMLYSW